MPSVDEVLSSMNYKDYIHDDIQFIIDNDLRTVSIPSDGVVIGVVGDKNINRVNFKMDRYYNGYDMATFLIRINYLNANGKSNYYTVDDLLIENDKLLFTWLVDSDATAYVGNVKFVVRLLNLSGSKILQAFDTSISEAKVLNGLIVDNYVTPEEEIDLLSHFKSDLDKYANDVVIPSIPEDYTALSDHVAENDNQIKSINSRVCNDLFIELTNDDFEQGVIDTTTGVKSDNPYWIRSKIKYYMPIKANNAFSSRISDDSMILYTLFYDENDNYIGSNFINKAPDKDVCKIAFLVRYDPLNTIEISPNVIFNCSIVNMLLDKRDLLITRMLFDTSLFNLDDFEITTQIEDMTYETTNGYFIRNSDKRRGFTCSYIYPAKELSIYCTDYDKALYMVCYDENLNYLGYCHPLNQKCYYSELDTFYMFTPEGTRYVGFNSEDATNIRARVWRINSENINVTTIPIHNNETTNSEYIAKSKVCIGENIVDSNIQGRYDCHILSNLGDYRYISVNYTTTIPIVFMNKDRTYTIPELTKYTVGNYIIKIPEDVVAIFVNIPQFSDTETIYNWKNIMRFYLWKELKPVYCFGDSVTWLDSRSGYGEHNFIFGYESHLRLNGYQAFNFGYNGMPYGTTTDGSKGIVQQFIESETDVSEIDSAVLAGGLNDVARWYSKTLVPGDISDYSYETLKDWEYKYDNTIDAIISLIVYIKRNAPHARIVLCNTIPSIATPYRELSTLKKFDSIVDDISILCGVTKCDLMRNMQITEHINNKDMVYDELTHLNNNGYIAMSNAIISKINELSNGTKNFVRWFDLNDAVITE